ncbi:MAG: ADP-ribosylation factor-like protein, partial [Candidatus Hodarchaeota archaeon]
MNNKCLCHKDKNLRVNANQVTGLKLLQIPVICPYCRKREILVFDETILEKPVGGLYRVSSQHNCTDKQYTVTIYLDKKFKVRQQLYIPLLHAVSASTPLTKEIVMCGLDFAGKTSIALRLQSPYYTPPVPTQLYNIEILSTPLFELSVIDLGGQSSFRHIWPQFVSKCSLVLWVIDQSDRSRFDESAEECQKILKVLPPDGSIPLLALLNKSDIPTSDRITEQDVKEGIIPFLPPNTEWSIFQTSAKTGKGLPKVFHWVQTNLFGYSRADPPAMREVVLLTSLGKEARLVSKPLRGDQLLDYNRSIQTLTESILQHNLSDLFINAKDLIQQLCQSLKTLAEENKANDFLHYLFSSFLSTKKDEDLLNFNNLIPSFQDDL